MKSKCFLLAFSLLIGSHVVAGQFQKVGFIDPYQVLSGQDDTAGLGADSYYGQLYSLGITKVVSSADEISTNNTYGIGIMGSDHKMIVAGNKEFDNLVHTAQNIYVQTGGPSDDFVPLGGVKSRVGSRFNIAFPKQCHPKCHQIDAVCVAGPIYRNTIAERQAYTCARNLESTVARRPIA